MARRSRRLILWFLAGTASLAALALLAVVALLWFIDPNDYRTQIESRASAAIGRPVHLTGTLRWQLGRQIFIVSEGGEIANAAGFGPGPLARWSRIRLGVAARPLFSRRVLMDRVAIDGLQLQLQRNAQGAVNWDLQMAGADDSAEQSRCRADRCRRVARCHRSLSGRGRCGLARNRCGCQRKAARGPRLAAAGVS